MRCVSPANWPVTIGTTLGPCEVPTVESFSMVGGALLGREVDADRVCLAHEHVRDLPSRKIQEIDI